MIGLTLFDRRMRETLTVIVSQGWKPDPTIYDVLKSVALPARFRDPLH